MLYNVHFMSLLYFVSCMLSACLWLMREQFPQSIVTDCSFCPLSAVAILVCLLWTAEDTCRWQQERAKMPGSDMKAKHRLTSTPAESQLHPCLWQRVAFIIRCASTDTIYTLKSLPGCIAAALWLNLQCLCTVSREEAVDLQGHLKLLDFLVSTCK